MVVFVETEPFYVLVKIFFMKSWSFLIKNGLFGGQIYFWNILNWFQLNLSKMMQLNWLQSQAEEIFSKKKSPKITNTRNGCLGGVLFLTRVHDGAGGDAYVCFHTCGAPNWKFRNFKQYLWFSIRVQFEIFGFSWF